MEVSEYLTMEEIKKRYPDEWVLLGDPETNEFCQFIGGTLIEHDRDKTSVLDRSKGKKPKHSAFLYTGEPDPNVVYML